MKLWMPNRLRSLRVVATMHRNVAGGDSDSRDLIETFRRVIAGLDLLNQNTEQGFLKIGGKLGEFVQVVKGISSKLTELTKSITGEQGLRASQALQQALDRSSEMRARAEEGTRLLDTMRQEAGRLKQTLSGFHATISTFHTLGVLTRIETARLGSAGADFGNLAEDVKALAGNIQTAVESNLETAGLLIPSIADAIHDIAAVEAGQSKDLPSVISGVLASLASFHEKQDGAHDSSVRLLARYDAISKAFGKLIVSMQFHDITRQQVAFKPKMPSLPVFHNRTRQGSVYLSESSATAVACSIAGVVPDRRRGGFRYPAASVLPASASRSPAFCFPAERAFPEHNRGRNGHVPIAYDRFGAPSDGVLLCEVPLVMDWWTLNGR
jgi:hypothetical protein